MPKAMTKLQEFAEYVKATCTPGSNLPGSYMRALRYLSGMLHAHAPRYAHLPQVWEIDSLDCIEELYAFIKSEEKKGDSSVFASSSFPKSYFKQRYCTSALKAFGRFLSSSRRDELALAAYETKNDARDVASAISRLPIIKPKMYLDDDVAPSSKVGKDTIRAVKQRQNQGLFRKMVLMNFGGVCCVSGLPVAEALRASHIVGWAEDVSTRLLPTNGLCLAATYDAAFDRHLISFDEDYRLILSSSLHEYFTNDAFVRTFREYEGRQISRAIRFQPSQELLQRHREQMP